MFLTEQKNEKKKKNKQRPLSLFKAKTEKKNFFAVSIKKWKKNNKTKSNNGPNVFFDNSFFKFYSYTVQPLHSMNPIGMGGKLRNSHDFWELDAVTVKRILVASLEKLLI